MTEEKVLDYRPYGASREAFSRKDRELLLSGPAGTGKSRGVLEVLHARAMKYPDSRQLIVRKTRTSLTTTTLITYNRIVLPPGHADVNFFGARYPNGSVIDFGGMDKASKIMSSEYDTIAFFEATEGTEDDWESLSTRLRWGKIPYQQLIGDCNPGAPSHWLKKRANTSRMVMLESRHEDNPMLWDGQGWTDRGKVYLERLDALTGVRYLRLRKGIWAAAEGMVYDQWNPAVHVIDRREIPRNWPRVWVVDFGYTNPFVWQAWAMDPDGRWYRYHEIYKTQTLVQDHAAQIRRVCLGEPVPLAIVCDHDAEDRATLERYLGLGTVPAYKFISSGIQAVQKRLRVAGDGRPRIFFMRDSLIERDSSLDEAHKPACTEEEIESYVWPTPGGPVTKQDTPVKKDDHGCDATRYLVAFVDDLAVDPGFGSRTVTYVDDYVISAI